MFRNLFHRLRIGPPHRALLCHDLFHTSSRASYPRGKPRSQEDANRERGDTVANWENYLQGSDAHLEPLERRVMIRSGMIRMDSANQPKVDGEEDLFIRANEENKPTLIPGHHRKDRSLQPHVSVASKPEHGKIEDAKGTLEYFFETPETRDNLVGSIKTFGSSRSAQTLAYPSEFPSDNNLRSETFSYEPGKASFRFNPVLDAESPTMNPVGQDQGFIEDQYFSQSLSSSTAQTPEQPQNLRSSDGSISNSDLNTFDEQYFSTDISDPVSMPIAGLDLERVQQLVRDSTREMNLIDEQLFGQISDQDTLKPYEAHDPDPAESRPETEGEKNRREKYEMIQKCKERRERKKLTRDPLPQVSGALAYVQKLRREAKTAANTATKTKEDFVDEINIGIQRRLTMAAGITDVEETINENETKRALKNQMKREGSLPPEPIPATQVKDSFKPEDFSKFSPVEIEEILANRVVLNDYDILAINKPYGLSVTGSSESFVVLNRYLPFLATKFESPDLKPVHRLDKTTSGILLMAKTEERYEDLKRLFKDRRIDKTYWAIVRGVPEPSQGIINIPLAETSFEGKYRMTVSPDYSEFNRRDRNKGERDVWRKKTNPKRKEVFPAVTEYKVLRSNVHMSLLEVKPITGYTHQIRAHLGLGLGCPVLGDHKYSDVTRIDRPQRLSGEALHRLGIRQSRARDLPIFLHCKHVQIPEIVPKKNVWIDAPLPHFFNKVMRKLKLSPPKFVKV